MIYGKSLQAFRSSRIKQGLKYLPQAAMFVLVIPGRALIINVPEESLIFSPAFKWWFVPAAIIATALAVWVSQKDFRPAYAVIIALLIAVWLVISAVDLLPFPYNLIAYVLLVGSAFAYGIILSLKPDERPN